MKQPIIVGSFVKRVPHIAVWIPAKNKLNRKS